jgi:hypothetical protein
MEYVLYLHFDGVGRIAVDWAYHFFTSLIKNIFIIT